MALTIDAKRLNFSSETADKAWQTALREHARLLELLAKSSDNPAGLSDRQAIESQTITLKKAKHAYDCLQAWRIVGLSKAIHSDRIRYPNFNLATNSET